LEGSHLATIPMVLDRYLVTSSLDGEILILNKLDGSLRKSYPTETEVRNQPIVVKGRDYVTSTNGQITCVDTKNRQLDGWPMFLKNNAHNCELGSNP
jgi:outer membrane protein assembly factor BamB